MGNLKRYRLKLEEDEAGGEPCFIASHPELEGCMADGRTMAEAVQNLADARDNYIAALREHGIKVPEPSIEVPDVYLALLSLAPTAIGENIRMTGFTV